MENINRRKSLFGFLALAATASGQGSSATWPDAVFKLEDAKTQKAPYGELTVYFEGKTPGTKSMTAGTLVLHPGQEPHPPHQHPEEEFMLITEGTGTILVSGKNTEVGPGALMYCEGNRLHGIKNTGSTPMRFYFMKWLA
jgi:quercetin dioxygenase-like cupin family protein